MIAIQTIPARNPSTILNSTKAAISRTPTARSFLPACDTASPMHLSVAGPTAGSLKDVRGPRRQVAVKAGQRLRAEDPARPVDPEAERAQAAQEPPAVRGAEHVELVGLLG